MDCHVYVRLREHYEAALKHSRHVILSIGEKPDSAQARLDAQLKKKALEELNDATDRMHLHKQTCQACNPNLKA
jgi:radical SAM superfamily enzyme